MLRGAGCFLRAQSRSGDHTINSFTEWENASGTITFWGKTVGMNLFLRPLLKLKKMNSEWCLGFHFFLRKRFIRTVLPQKVIVPDAFSHFVKELIVWSPERLWARKKHPAARSIDRGTRSYVFVKVHAPKRSRGSCKCDSWKFIGGKLLSNKEKQLHPIRRVKMDTNRWKRSQ